ncbi:hypothetical protein BHC44_06415 [Snodgrassella alvi]|uniref:Uncharacterized protein n=1 Tax=Snodgrassella alvi TaxID=1196083 RepID=A0A2N9XXB0_9NEIS|nr:hypothetical protein [Snodgrassella alvi]PIT53226.1 hypothetical protein BHC44_06415 [Snodgrassella alvi]PIT54517.1 hypothetical protein BHC49_08195 [Snodgrassella alvi]
MVPSTREIKKPRFTMPLNKTNDNINIIQTSSSITNNEALLEQHRNSNILNKYKKYPTKSNAELITSHKDDQLQQPTIANPTIDNECL